MNQHTDDWRGEHLIRAPRRPKPEPVVRERVYERTFETKHPRPVSPEQAARDALLRQAAASGLTIRQTQKWMAEQGHPIGYHIAYTAQDRLDITFQRERNRE